MSVAGRRLRLSPGFLLVTRAMSNNRPSALFTVTAPTVRPRRAIPGRGRWSWSGFGGALPRHVARYADLYNRKGCHAVSGTASNYQTFVHGLSSSMHGGTREFALDAVRTTAGIVRGEREALRRRPPVVIHCLSNGGAFVMRRIGDLLLERSRSGDCGGGDDDDDGVGADLDLFAASLGDGCQVLDSAPCHIDPTSAYGVVRNLLGPSPAGPPAALAAWLLAAAAGSIARAAGRPPPGGAWWDALVRDSACGRQAFVYTPDDDVCDHVKVEEFISARRGRGTDVVATRRIEGSRHVQHLRLHPEVYSAFVDEVLASLDV